MCEYIKGFMNDGWINMDANKNVMKSLNKYLFIQLKVHEESEDDLKMSTCWLLKYWWLF